MGTHSVNENRKLQIPFNYTLDPYFTKICKKSSMEMAVLKQKRATFVDLASVMEQIIKDSETSNSDHKWARIGEGASRFVSIASGAAIGVMGLFGSSVAVAASLAVSYGYEISLIIVKAINKELTTKDAIAFSAKTKTDSLDMILQASSKASSQTAKKILGPVVELVNIGMVIQEQIQAFEQGGNLNISTAGHKKQLIPESLFRKS